MLRHALPPIFVAFTPPPGGSVKHIFGVNVRGFDRTRLHRRAIFAAALMFLSGGSLVSGAEGPIINGSVIQIDVSSLLNARAVTTLTDGKLITWNRGIDGGGRASGYLTHAAAVANGDVNPLALPDVALIPATAAHPDIQLHYANADGSGNQTCAVASEFSFAVPAHRYSGLFLALTSAEGASTLHCELIYSDGSETRDVICPDYFKDIAAEDADFSYVLTNLAKWNAKNAMVEKSHHNIDALNLHPDAQRTLTRVAVKKDKGGYLVFWAATGIVAAP